MATVPVPRTWTVGELLTAAKLNADLRNGLNFLLSGKPLASLAKTTNQSVPNSTFTVVTWNSEIIDRDGGHDNATNNSRYTSQTAGWYRVVAHLVWNANFTAKIRQTNFVRSAAQAYFLTSGFGDADGNNGSSTAVGLIFLSVGDYLEVHGNQASGAALDITAPNTHFDLEWTSS
ncbi:hypothetical protein [Nonomuraea sp. NPDC049709]|uniref:hypothetical protein n=1 Tax=Nonomuraea sp. NPDC049709 TaxID=3154736 RepID=UPI0034329F93